MLGCFQHKAEGLVDECVLQGMEEDRVERWTDERPQPCPLWLP